MAFRGVGLIYSDEEARPERPFRSKALSLGIAAGAGATAFAYGINPGADGSRPIDNLARYARTAGNLSPYQILNTFRAPEFLSPFTSPAYQKLDQVGNKASLQIGSEFFHNKATVDYLRTLTGLSTSELATKGIDLSKDREAAGVASHLLFEKNANNINGALYSQVGDTKHLLHSNVALMTMGAETPSVLDLTTKNQPVNKAAKSVFAAMDMYKNEGFSTKKVFLSMAGGEAKRPAYMPIPGFDLSLRGTTYLRSVGAFNMERFNTLVSNVGHELLGPTFTNATARMGLKLGIRPGPMTSMYARAGLLATGVGAVGLGISQLDYYRRQSLAGQAVASGVVSFGLGGVMARAGFGPKAAMMAGVASFAGQMIMPGFDQGVIPGIASAYVGAKQLRASDLNPGNYYRRTLEGFLPGVSKASFGALLGVGLVTAANLRLPNGQLLTNQLLDTYGHASFGLAKQTSRFADIRAPKTTRDHFWDHMMDYAQKNIGHPEVNKIFNEYQSAGKVSSFGMRTRLMSAIKHSNEVSTPELSEKMNQFWSKSEEMHRMLEKHNPLNIALAERLEGIAGKYSGKSDFVSKAMMQLEGMAEQARHGFFGAHLSEKGLVQRMGRLGFKSPLGTTGLLFMGALVGQQLVTGGFLGSMETSKQLRDIYSGKQLVHVGKGRGWELGGTPIGGTDEGEYRPHWYPLMMNRTRQKGIWGSSEDRRSPIEKFLVSNFTYNLERQNYYTRPYPITDAAFSNLPIIGPALAATIGQVFKPSKLMHAGEWISSTDGGMQFASVYEGWKREPAYELGAHDPGIPKTPYNARSVLGEIDYHQKELSGLTGYVTGLAQSMLTGRETMLGEGPQLANSGMMTSPRKAFWDMSLGGGGPLGEIVRRALPSFSNDYDRVNPIINSMPQWMPNNLKYGDPYSAFSMGEGRLPGPGYAAIHPELKDVDPEEYPLIYRYDILTQVSPRSKQFRETRDALYAQAATGKLSPDAMKWMSQIDETAVKQWNLRDFSEDSNEIKLPGSWLTRNIWSHGKRALRTLAAPVEYAVPGGFFRPFQKFMSDDRDPIEQYEYERMYGAGAFWNKPYRDWLRPTVNSLAHLMGWSGKPLWRKQADAVNQQFDQLEFYKWMTLAQQAAASGETQKKIQYEYQAANTRMGVNPYGNPLSIYWTLPSEERAFFNSFAFAQGSDRDRILKMVPEDQVELYKTVWSRVDSGDTSLWSGNATKPNEQYLQQQMATLDGGQMPSADWIGYNKDVDLRDIKVKYVNELGADMRDYGLWEKELRKADSQPFLQGSTSVFHEGPAFFRGATGRDLSDLFRGDGPTNVSVFTSNASRSNVSLEYNDSREAEIRSKVWSNF